MKKLLLAGILAAIIFINHSLKANGEIYLSVGESLIVFEGPNELLNLVDISDNKIKIDAPPGTNFKLSLGEQKTIKISPDYYTTHICGENTSQLDIETPSGINSTAFEISVEETFCELGVTSPKLPPIENVRSVIKNLQQNSEAVRIVRQIAVPISITVTAASAGALTISATVGSANFAFNITQLLQQLSILRFYALGFLRFKRKKPWGKVTDKLSGKPLRGALVQIYEYEFKKMKDAQITDADGRFSAIVTPGKYYLKVSRNGFETIETTTLNVTSPDQILNLEISLSPTINAVKDEYIKRINFWNRLKKIIDVINPYLLAFGTVVGIINIVIVPNGVNYAGLLIYIILDTVKIYLAFSFIKPFGKVLDETGAPVPLAVIRIFEEEKNILLSTKVTDENGRFNFLLSRGKYYITCSKSGFAPYRSNELLLTESGLATLDINLKSTP